MALFFFYGTLIDASDTPMARWLRPSLRSARPATMSGRLSAIRTSSGWYPALHPAPRWQRVRGLCCELDLAPRDIARLDRYEGREYRRLSGRARVGGSIVSVQYYGWRRGLPACAQTVPGGDFLGWLQRRRRRAYGSRTGLFGPQPNSLHRAISSAPETL